MSAKTGFAEADAGGVAGAEHGDGPVGEVEEALAGPGFGGLRMRPSPLRRATVWVISTVPASRSILGPEDGEGFADADAGGEHEGGQVGEVGLDRVVVVDGVLTGVAVVAGGPWAGAGWPAREQDRGHDGYG